MPSAALHIITGSTGFLGRYLLERLLEQSDNRIILIVRKPSRKEAEELPCFSDPEKRQRISILLGDIRLPGLGIAEEDWRQTITSPATFWHLAANLSFDYSEEQEIVADNVVGTENVVELVNSVLPDGSDLRYVSTAYVCGSRLSADEAPPSAAGFPRNPYERTKQRAERALWNGCRKPFVIFRPSIIIGDAYEGKAVGCTFGYYRFAYVFYVFKRWAISRAARASFFTRASLKLVGMNSESTSDRVSFSRLWLPYPRGVFVNMVPVDFVVRAMLDLESRVGQRAVVHLTHPSPPSFHFLQSALLSDLGLDGIRLLPIPPFAFRILIRSAYALLPSWRKYLESAEKYLPYIARNYRFDTGTLARFGIAIPPLDREYVRRINQFAAEKIFDRAGSSSKSL